MSSKAKPLPDTLAEKLASLPTRPGCYIYKDAQGEVLYVGKAINLRNRVRSYFQRSADHGIRIARLVSKVADLETIVVDSELEALVLECNLIKQHRPPYNVRLRDDKSYPYIVITKEKYPRVLFTRRVQKGNGRYFGPYSSSYSVRDTLHLLHKVFPLIPCGKPWSGEKERTPCLYYHLGRCLAPCAGMADSGEYSRVVDQVERFLKGQEETLINEIKAQMAKASEALDFERAASMRDQIKALEDVLSRQKVLAQDGQDRDVVALVKDGQGAAVQMLYVRGGKLVGQRQFILDGTKETSPSESVQEFVKQYYADAPEIPREVLLPVEIEENLIIQSWLRQRRGNAVTIEVPQGGEKLRLIEMAANNAELALQTMNAKEQQEQMNVEEAMFQLQEEIGLPEPPNRIECYDISNIQGTSPVSSMVVSLATKPTPAEYRRFKIRYHPESPNDFAMMHETITRRLRNYIEKDGSFAQLADLMVIDGGKGQLSAALRARDDLGLTVPMVGLAKRLELIYVPVATGKQLRAEKPSMVDSDYQYPSESVYEYEFNELELPMSSPALKALRVLRDEAHRFAITFHRKVRDKSVSRSMLEEIPGVGPRRKRLLLRTFGSLEGIRRATVDEIAAVPTLTKRIALDIHERLRAD